ncbi:MAG: hypothetical protein K6T94_22435 [Paenibacillus sp.]|nr:hypothetical protein [Paenibacillus sp.]
MDINVKTDMTIKRGDTFIYPIIWEGVAASELRSEVRDSIGDLISEVVISETSEPHTFILTVANTKNWPIDILYTDIERTYHLPLKILILSVQTLSRLKF